MMIERRIALWPWVALLVLTGGLYLFGLGSAYAPTNGDEMVYIHIARMTAQSGHWLPLQSEILDTRNTKPPLLFWQAMIAGDWGSEWTRWALRLPSVVYTSATAFLIALFAFRIAGNARTAIIAAVLYLLFFSTFRYGRVYLTSAPETFWLALPMWWLLWQLTRTTTPTQSGGVSDFGLGTYTLFGIVVGIGCAYKSFALTAPTVAAIWCAGLVTTPQLQWRWPLLLRFTVGLAWTTFLAIALFAIWFAIDPDPAAVWQEFVVAENAGKMSNPVGYWHSAWYGPYPMWTQLLAYPTNAGLLFFVVAGMAWSSLRDAVTRQHWRPNSTALRLLITWLAVWLIIFTIPSQRSERYLIPAMPALAVILALSWDRIPKLAFWLTLGLATPFLIMLARIAWAMHELTIAADAEYAITLIAAAAGLAGVIAGFLHKPILRSSSLAVVLCVYASFSLMVAPLDKPALGYSSATTAAMSNQRVAVPNGFTGQYERYHFVLPTANLVPYDAEGRNTGAWKPELPPSARLAYLLSQFDAVIWLQDDFDNLPPPCVTNCKLLGFRWHVKSRHKVGEITFNNVWQPQEWLFRREWLIQSTTLQSREN